VQLIRLDNDWPATGWSLGFGKLVFWMTTTPVESDVRGYAAMLVDADGTRHPYTVSQVEDFTEGPDRKFTARTTDGDLIDYSITYSGWTSPDPPTSGQAKYRAHHLYSLLTRESAHVGKPYESLDADGGADPVDQPLQLW
jgi:hypothetical protein